MVGPVIELVRDVPRDGAVHPELGIQHNFICLRRPLEQFLKEADGIVSVQALLLLEAFVLLHAPDQVAV